MSSDFIIGLGEQTLWTILKISAPALGLGLAVGLVISVLQATTQIQEQSLTFIPKILAVMVALVVFGPWMLTLLITFTESILGQLGQFVQ